jgi:hypothetical protein
MWCSHRVQTSVHVRDSRAFEFVCPYGGELKPQEEDGEEGGERESEATSVAL